MKVRRGFKKTDNETCSVDISLISLPSLGACLTKNLPTAIFFFSIRSSVAMAYSTEPIILPFKTLIHFRTQSDDSIRRGKLSGADERIQRILDFVGPLHWLPVAAEWIVGLNPNVDRGL